MEYTLLTDENRRDLLKRRLLDYEVAHYDQYCEYNLAIAQDLHEVAEQAGTKLAAFEKVIGWCVSELNQLQDTKTAPVAAP